MNLASYREMYRNSCPEVFCKKRCLKNSLVNKSFFLNKVLNKFLGTAFL